jgi:hypothetical protein
MMNLFECASAGMPACMLVLTNYWLLCVTTGVLSTYTRHTLLWMQPRLLLLPLPSMSHEWMRLAYQCGQVGLITTSRSRSIAPAIYSQSYALLTQTYI